MKILKLAPIALVVGAAAAWAGENTTAPRESINTSEKKCTWVQEPVYGTCTKQVCNAEGPNNETVCRDVQYECQTGTVSVCK